MARITGHKAKIYYNGILVAQMEDSTLKVSPKFAESVGWDDNWLVRDPVGGSDWSISASKFSTSGNFGQLMALAAITPQAIIPMTAIVWSRVAGVDTRILEGPVWAGDSEVTLPATDNSKESLEFVSAGAPTYIFGVSPIP